MLTADEIARGRAVLEREGKLSERSLFPTVMLVEPDKDAVRAFTPGDALERRVLFVVLEADTGVSTEYVVALQDDAIVDERVVPSDTFPYGQPPYTLEEFMVVEDIVKASPEWQTAMRRRGLEDRMDLAYCTPLAPGYFGYEDEIGRRMVRSLTFLRDFDHDNAWAHPVEGLLATVNLTTGEVVSLQDEGDVPTAAPSANYDAESIGEVRKSLKPIEITQPEGPSFSVDGGEVEWQNWKFRVGFNSREGLVLNQLTFTDGDDERPVLYRGSVPEMVVPYGDTSRNRYWISYFDAGEYHLGKNANSLALGCDCLGVIHYFDGVVADDHGRPAVIPQVVCMHEEDAGVLWKHTEMGYKPDVRRQRRLVISYFATVGNYDYGFYWYLYLDGSIEVEAKATGLVFTGSGEPGAEDPHRLEISPGLFAPVHQHLFCARLDVEIDGPDNFVDEVDVVGIPKGDRNPYGNAFTWERRRIETEGGRLADGLKGRTWHIGSATRTNYVGKPTEYQLIPEGLPVLMADPDSTVHARANFAAKHTWVSKYEPGELWPAGDYPNQHAGGAGLPAYTEAGESVDGGDIVLWHVFGPTHLPRTEDWPIMPVDVYRFKLKPNGFFDRNPALDIPDWSAAPAGDSCCHAQGDDEGDDEGGRLPVFGVRTS
ncbi:primary-amine oxidase [Pseudoclavibacter endophyticus]|uniref:Amine oxidase n=2 Tax=Pseudoclavibacter endophyticus TaxID=1778590 RepID=A0A6H9WPD1_9MICO|nr:primary-amine oxidase [Pseudoclavibacter endophyticus]